MFGGGRGGSCSYVGVRFCTGFGEGLGGCFNCTVICPGVGSRWCECDGRVVVFPLYLRAVWLELWVAVMGSVALAICVGRIVNCWVVNCSERGEGVRVLAFMFLASCCCQVSGRAGIIVDVGPQGMCALMWWAACG